MPSFGRPDPDLVYDLQEEMAAIDNWFAHREVPTSQPGHVLLASWNIANLGEQDRDPKDLDLIAHILRRFDLIAVQEVKENLEHFCTVAEHLGQQFDWVVNDTAGNQERLAFVYRKDKVQPRRLFGEVAIPERLFPRHTVVVPYTYRRQRRVEVFYNLRFTPFDRNPFIGTFRSGNLDFALVNVHLYFGAFKDSKKVVDRAKYARRVLEIFVLAKWAKKRQQRPATYDRDIILLGDMNVPQMDDDDAAFAALKRSGLRPLDYHSKTGGSNLDGSKTYDQIAITPTLAQRERFPYDVFDFDNAVFAAKWNALVEEYGEEDANPKFNPYVKFHISDHRPIWMQLDTAV